MLVKGTMAVIKNVNNDNNHDDHHRNDIYIGRHNYIAARALQNVIE